MFELKSDIFHRNQLIVYSITEILFCIKKRKTITFSKRIVYLYNLYTSNSFILINQISNTKPKY